MREAAELAESSRRLLEIERGEGIGIRAIGLDSKPVEEGTADQMGQPSRHRAKSEIDARFTKISRQQLRMGVGNMQDARIAEAFEIVNAGMVGAARERWPAARERGACEFKKIAAADGHALSPRHCRIGSAYFEIFPRAFFAFCLEDRCLGQRLGLDRKSTRLN